jgi:transcriptional regulator with XRE-family HTH domain
MRRILLGMSQEKLGEAIELTFQQVQKYEKGTNRIGASRLQQIAKILNVPPGFFFDGAPVMEGTPSVNLHAEFSEDEDLVVSLSDDEDAQPPEVGAVSSK